MHWQSPLTGVGLNLLSASHRSQMGGALQVIQPMIPVQGSSKEYAEMAGMSRANKMQVRVNVECM